LPKPPLGLALAALDPFAQERAPIDEQFKPTGTWSGTENAIIRPLLPAAERMTPTGRLSKAEQWRVLVRSPVMWFMVVVIALSVAAFVVLWVLEEQRTPSGPKDPLSLSRAQAGAARGLLGGAEGDLPCRTQSRIPRPA